MFVHIIMTDMHKPVPLRFVFHSKSHQHTCLNIMFRLEEQPDHSGYTILLILHWFEIYLKRFAAISCHRVSKILGD
jgi:hypothetical protein